MTVHERRPVEAPLRRAAAAAMIALLVGCAGAPAQDTLRSTREQSNPTDRAQRTITNFTPALRCMDDMLFNAGVRDVTMMMEEMRDATQRVPVATRDMMTSAISEMTRRSRAVKLSLFGSDQINLTQALQQAQRSSVFGVLPEYGLRGAVSQIDDDVKRDSNSLSLLGQLFGVRFGSEARFSVLGFDAALVRTESFTLVPGVTSKNTTVIVRRDASASDGQARLRSGSATFAFSAARSEGTAQAARNMVELAAIELVGKITRLPYWQCLGTPDDDAEVVREIDDWFLAMDDDERVVFVKERLRERRWFDGALDANRDSAGFVQALSAYRAAMGVPVQGPLDQTFFRRFVVQSVPRGPLATPRAKAQPSGAAAAAAPSTPPLATVAPAVPVVAASSISATPASPAPAASTSPPVALRLDSIAGRATLEVSARAPGYVYCYAQDAASRAIRRIYPNRFERDPRIEPGKAVALPGRGRFVLDPAQDYACIYAAREVYGDLPAVLRWGDFDEVRLPTFEEIRSRFADASGLDVALVRANRSGAGRDTPAATATGNPRAGQGAGAAQTGGAGAKP